MVYIQNDELYLECSYRSSALSVKASVKSLLKLQTHLVCTSLASSLESFLHTSHSILEKYVCIKRIYLKLHCENAVNSKSRWLRKKHHHLQGQMEMCARVCVCVCVCVCVYST